jgi:hypothetical protein
MSQVYKCDICIKNYKTYQTLWKHNKNFHPQNSAKTPPNSASAPPNSAKTPPNSARYSESIADDTDVSLKCVYCLRQFMRSDYLYKHINMNRCKKKQEHDNENKQLKSDLEALKEHIKELLNTHNKIHPKTLQKMINNTNSNNNTNNGTINNVNIISLGNENIPALFNTTEKLEVLNKKNNALYHLIEKVHFNDNYPQFKNIFITNNRHNEAHLYDINSNKFKVVDKEEAINDIIEYRVCDIEEFYEELGEKLDPKAKDILENLFRERGDDNITRDRVKLLIYNNKKN